MFYKSISVNYSRHTKPSYKEVLAPNKVLNEHQVNRQPFWWRHWSSPWDGNESCFLPFVFKLLIPFLFGGNQAAGDQLKLFSFKHTNLPRPRNARVGLPAPASRGETTCWRRSSFYWDSKGNNVWILLKQRNWNRERREEPGSDDATGYSRRCSALRLHTRCHPVVKNQFELSFSAPWNPK